MDITPYKENQKTTFLAAEYERLETHAAEVRELVDSDPDMKQLADDDLASIQEQQTNLLAQMDAILKEEAEEERFPNEVILEVRAGAGGDEAALFAADLANMYRGYAEVQNWGVRTLSESISDLGGYKEASFEIRGKKLGILGYGNIGSQLSVVAEALGMEVPASKAKADQSPPPQACNAWWIY